ncbi:MAG: transglycosylase SLT domain-containing protein [bacterium]
MKSNLLINLFNFSVILVLGILLCRNNRARSITIITDNSHYQNHYENIAGDDSSHITYLSNAPTLECNKPWLFSERFVVNIPHPIIKEEVETFKIEENINLNLCYINKKAKRIFSLVKVHGERFKISPQLIMAIIHTESSFNPRARSSKGAVGLMQLIPKYGAQDAFHFVYDNQGIPSRKYLYDPENNIELGTAYLALLQNKHFGRIKDTLKNNYLTICAYNRGPSAIKKIINKYDIEHIDSQELYSLLINKAPRETRDYLKKVMNRIKIYDSLFS